MKLSGKAFPELPTAGDRSRLYFRARMYMPGMGRWLSKDPLGFVDGPNQYSYVRNAPIVRFDPTGLKDECICFYDRSSVVQDKSRIVYLAVAAWIENAIQISTNPSTVYPPMDADYIDCAALFPVLYQYTCFQLRNGSAIKDASFIVFASGWKSIQQRYNASGQGILVEGAALSGGIKQLPLGLTVYIGQLDFAIEGNKSHQKSADAFCKRALNGQYGSSVTPPKPKTDDFLDVHGTIDFDKFAQWTFKVSCSDICS